MASVEILLGKHTQPIPDGLVEMLTEVLEAAGIEGRFGVRMGAAIKGKHHLKKVMVTKLLPSGIVVKAQPGDNKTRRVCTIPLEGHDGEDMCTRLKMACTKLYGQKEEDNGVKTDEEVEEDYVCYKMDVVSEEVSRKGSESPETTESDKEADSTETADGSWRERVKAAITDDGTRAIILAEIAGRLEDKQLSSKAASAVLRGALDLDLGIKNPKWATRDAIEYLLRCGLLEEIKLDNGARVSAYRLTPKAWQEIATVDSTVAKKAEEPAVVPAAAGVLDMVRALRERADAYERAQREEPSLREELERKDGEMNELNKRLAELLEERMVVEEKLAHCRRTLDDPDAAAALRQMEEIRMIAK